MERSLDYARDDEEEALEMTRRGALEMTRRGTLEMTRRGPLEMTARGLDMTKDYV